jgi:hypothetical protein
MKTFGTRKVTIGSEVRCSEGECGHLRRVVIEPIERVVTHMIVKPGSGERTSRLVPVSVVESVEPGKPGRILLRCSLAEFESFECAHERHFLAGASGHWNFRQEQMLSWPHYRLGLGGGAGVSDVPAETETRRPMPGRTSLGEVQVRRGDRMQATDGPLGRVQGLIVDRFDQRVTHVLLDEGHIWGQKRAAIPIGSVIDLNDITYGVHVDLTRDQVDNLPPVELDIQE